MSDISERVVELAERIESLDVDTAFEELEPLDVKVTSSLRGNITSIVLVIGTGGPHIEVDVSNSIIRGFWGNEEHTTYFRNNEVADALHDYYEELWKETR